MTYLELCVGLFCPTRSGVDLRVYDDWPVRRPTVEDLELLGYVPGDGRFMWFDQERQVVFIHLEFDQDEGV